MIQKYPIPVAGSRQFCINFDRLVHDNCLDLLRLVWRFSMWFSFSLSVCVISSTLCVPLPTHESTRLPRCGRGNSCVPPGSGRFQRSPEHDGEITTVGIRLELGRSWKIWAQSGLIILGLDAAFVRESWKHINLKKGKCTVWSVSSISCHIKVVALPTRIRRPLQISRTAPGVVGWYSAHSRAVLGWNCEWSLWTR